MTEEDWCRSAVLLREKRFGLDDLQNDWDEKVRQARFLNRRGFSGSQVERALEARLPSSERRRLLKRGWDHAQFRRQTGSHVWLALWV